MNKIFSIATLVALATTLSFAQDTQLGIRAQFNLNNVTTGNGKEIDEKYGIGMGGGGGLVAIIPISGNLAARTGAEIIYRTLYNMDVELPGSGSVKQSATEFALSIPALVQYTLFEVYWLGVGVQLDIPFASEINTDGNSSKFKDRSAVDFGIILNLGWNVTKNIVVDIRGNIVGLVLTNISTQSGDKSSNYPASGGFTYLF